MFSTTYVSFNNSLFTQFLDIKRLTSTSSNIFCIPSTSPALQPQIPINALHQPTYTLPWNSISKHRHNLATNTKWTSINMCREMYKLFTSGCKEHEDTQICSDRLRANSLEDAGVNPRYRRVRQFTRRCRDSCQLRYKLQWRECAVCLAEAGDVTPRVEETTPRPT